jgi:thiamine biosynthesis lipoprotein
LSDQALSVSSSLGQSSEIEGRRYGHVVDPRTGQALAKRRRAIVVAQDATWAEVLSTALLVLDEAEATTVLTEQGAQALVIDEQGHHWNTPGWQAATGYERR